jgi:periplasmic divalent cation tolerance protein
VELVGAWVLHSCPNGRQAQVETEPGRDYYQVSVTAPTEEEACALGRVSVEGRLAACSQVSGPVTSTYWWEGEVTSATEYVCTLKTAADRLPALMEAVKEAHSYEVPEIVAVPLAAGDSAYLAWIEDETAER